MIEAAGASLLYNPPYSPDFNPIEQAFSKLKALLRKAAERTIHGLWNAIGRILDLYSPAECANYLANAGYDADRSKTALAPYSAPSPTLPGDTITVPVPHAFARSSRWPRCVYGGQRRSVAVVGLPILVRMPQTLEAFSFSNDVTAVTSCPFANGFGSSTLLGTP